MDDILIWVQLILIILKVVGATTLSWVAVFTPLWIMLIIILIAMLVGFIALLKHH